MLSASKSQTYGDIRHKRMFKVPEIQKPVEMRKRNEFRGKHRKNNHEGERTQAGYPG